MTIEAMKQALEALETLDAGDTYKTHNAASALRQAIEQAEMVEKGTKAWADTPDDWVDDLRGGAEKPWVKTYAGGKLNYTTPEEKQVRTHTPEDIKKIESKWVGLTDEEIQVVVNKVASGEYQYSDTFARAIEAKLKEKNT